MRRQLVLLGVALFVTAVSAGGCPVQVGEITNTPDFIGSDDCLCETPGLLPNVTFGDFADLDTNTVPTNFSIGFLADGALSANGLAVLDLAANLSVDAIIHPGGLDGADDPDGWFAAVDSALGAGFPYFPTIGRTELPLWLNYSSALKTRFEALDDTACSGTIGVNTYCVHKGVGFSLTAPGLLCGGADDAIAAAFADSNDPPNWRICAFAQPQAAVSGVGSYSPLNSAVGWAPYEACRDAGAFVVTGDAAVFARSKPHTLWADSPGFTNWPASDVADHICPTTGPSSEGKNFAMNVGFGGGGMSNGGGGASSALADRYTALDNGGAPGLVVCTFNVNGADANTASCSVHIVGEDTAWLDWTVDVADDSCDPPTEPPGTDGDDEGEGEDETDSDAQQVLPFADSQQFLLFVQFCIGAIIVISIAVVKMWSIATSPSLMGDDEADAASYLEKKGTTMTIGFETPSPSAAQETPETPKAPSRFLPSMTAGDDDDDDDDAEAEAARRRKKKKAEIPVDEKTGLPLIMGEDSDDEDSDDDDPRLQGGAKSSTEGTIMNLEDIFAMAKKGDTAKIDAKDSSLLKRPDDGDDSSDDSSDDSGPRRGSDRNKPVAKKKGSSGGGASAAAATASVSASASGRKGLRLRSGSDSGSARQAANNASAIMGLLAGGIGSAGVSGGSGSHRSAGSNRGSSRRKAGGSSRGSSRRKAAGSTHSSGSDRVKDAEKAKHHVIAPDDENTGDKASAALAVLKMAIPDTVDGAAADKSLVATTGLTKRQDATSPDATAIVAARVAKSLSHQGAAEVGEAEFNAIVKNVVEDDGDEAEEGAAGAAGAAAEGGDSKKEKKEEEPEKKKGSKRKGSSRRRKSSKD